jgi:hypothetical protein
MLERGEATALQEFRKKAKSGDEFPDLVKGAVFKLLLTMVQSYQKSVSSSDSDSGQVA